ncbi:MAG: thioredoxin domain-containing protein [Sphingobium sp.]|nr:thioredoxin domain-containing protein [Sphingobium sp.]
MTPARIAPLILAVAALAGCNKSSDTSTSAPKATEAIKAVAAPTGTSWTDKVDTTPDGGVRMGNPDAPVKLVEYGSLSCPHCAKLAQEGAAKIEEYVASGRISYEYRSTIIHPQDVPLTLLARCNGTATFFPLVDQIYANFDAMSAPLGDEAVQKAANAALQGPPQQRMSGLADALKYTEFFAQRGLPVEKAHACLADGAKVKELSDLSTKYGNEGITGTPTLFINGAKVDTTEWAVLNRALADAGVR